MKNWTKWYKQTLDKAREKNSAEKKKSEGLSEREKETRDMLMKQYGLLENAVSEKSDKLREIQNDNLQKVRENQVKRDFDKSKIEENLLKKGDNRVDSNHKESELIDDKHKNIANKIQRQTQENEDKTIKSLRDRVKEVNEFTESKIKDIDEKYDKLSEEKYKYVKNRIDYLLSYNDTGTGDIFFNIKDNLLNLIEQNKADLSESKYKELCNYVNSKIFIDSDSLKNNVTLFVNDQELIMSAREFEWSTKITCNTVNKIGMVFGELINVQYDGRAYKAKVGTIADDEVSNVVKAIAKRKKMSVEVGTCVAYEGRVYMFSGDNIWRLVVDRGGANYNDGMAALIKKYNEDIYNDAYKEVTTNEKKSN